MSDLEKLKEVLLNQQERGIRSGDWPEAEATITKQENGHIHLTIESAGIIFVFNRLGRFLGIVNYR